MGDAQSSVRERALVRGLGQLGELKVSLQSLQ